METPPVPSVSTVCPARIGTGPESAVQAVTAAQGRVEPSSKVSASGRRTTASCDTTLYSASQPSDPLP